MADRVADLEDGRSAPEVTHLKRADDARQILGREIGERKMALQEIEVVGELVDQVFGSVHAEMMTFGIAVGESQLTS